MKTNLRASVLALAMACGAGGSETIAEPEPPPAVIGAIRFEGNRRTRPQTMLREMTLRPGDRADPELIEQSRQAIMNLELFKSVEAVLAPEGDAQVLVITVREKRYFFPLPIIGRDGDGDWTLGAQTKFDNVRGRNHQLDIEAEVEYPASNADVEEEKTLRIDYVYPRILNGPWRINAGWSYQEALLEENRDGLLGDYERRVAGMGLLASRWKRSRGPSRGWNYGGGLSYQSYAFDLIRGEPGLFFDTTEVGLRGQFGFTNVYQDDFNRWGRDFSYVLNVFPTTLGSSKDRLIHSTRYRSYNRITRRPHTNLNLQLRWALATKSLFGAPTFDLGGSTRLRGYDRQGIEGNGFILCNVEFLTPVVNSKEELRGVLFLDVGDAFRDSGNFTLGHLEFGAGAGLRLKIRSFVKVELRLDVAHGFDRNRGGNTRVYAGSNATF